MRELEEELGLTGPLVQKLQHLFTLACTNRGETARHGAFTCNEFQEIFLLPVGPRHDLPSYKYPPGEVTDVSQKLLLRQCLGVALSVAFCQSMPVVHPVHRPTTAPLPSLPPTHTHTDQSDALSGP